MTFFTVAAAAAPISPTLPLSRDDDDDGDGCEANCNS